MSRHPARWGAAGLVAALGCALVSAGPSQGLAPRSSLTVVAPSAHVDGRIAVYDANADRIDTLNPDGSARFPVTPEGESSFHPAWAPDGSRLAFASNHAGADIRIFTVKPDGSDLRQVTTDGDGFNHFSPTYTADGARIIFSRCLPDPGGCALSSVRTNGSDRRALTTPVDDQVDFWPDASPDGQRISFTRFGYRGIQVQTWVMKSNGSGAHPITTPAFEAGAAKWTGDSRHLLVTNLFAHLGENIYRISDDGTQRQRLTDSRFPHSSMFASPSPSGARIVFADDRAYPLVMGGDLFVMRADGSGEHSITSDGRTLENDWGTAPLVAPARAQAPSEGTAPSTRAAGGLSPRVAALLALTRGTSDLGSTSRQVRR